MRLPMSEAQQKLTAAANAYRAAEIKAFRAGYDYGRRDAPQYQASYLQASAEADAAWFALTEAIHRWVP